MSYGICCIVLSLADQDPPVKFQTMTYKRFSSLEISEALNILGGRILNNMNVTFECIKFCNKNNYTYRISSDLFPLMTYDKADVQLSDLPQCDEILSVMNKIKTFVASNPTRVSCHPSEFNVLASFNSVAVEKTIKELNYYSWFMDKIGCPADYNSPMNIHIHSNAGERSEVVERFMINYNRLDINCRNRLVIENDDKLNCWSVNKLIKYMTPVINIPITFDYLHHKCHPDGLTEQEAFELCVDTWGQYKPLFHYSESRVLGDNPRAHADYLTSLPDTYGVDVDIDLELKMKDKCFEFLPAGALQ